MPPKKPATTKAESKARAAGETGDDVPLQAVVLADSYNRRFEVLCQDQPRILLPLCSIPLLNWTLESLSMSKVKQVFVFCGVHTDKIREFVSKSPYRYTMDIQCLSSRTARTAGDALRDLDAMHVLNPDNPFLLVHSPLISNYDLSRMVEAHKKRRETDKNIIMTMGVGRGGSRHPESPIMVVDPSNSRLLHYSQNPIYPHQSRVTIPTSIFLDAPAGVETWEIWSGASPHASPSSQGYRDLGVDVCEADVPALCTENFDYHDLRRHFVIGVLTSELLGKKIGVHIVGGNSDQVDGVLSGGTYVDRVRDTRTYAEISMDVLNRSTFPLTPDVLGSDKGQYELRRGNVYIARDHVSLGRTTKLSGPLLIGPRSALNEGSHVSASTLGADCSVGPHTTISRSYIFDNVTIGDHCNIVESIIGSDVKIGDGVEIGIGCLVGNGVVLGKGVALPDFTRVGRERFVPDDLDSDEEDEEDDDEKSHRLSILGTDSVGYLWPSEETQREYNSDDEDDEDPYEHPQNKTLLQLGRRLSHLSSAEESVSTLSVASSSTASTPLSMASSDDSLPDIPSLALDAVNPAFHTEAVASLERAFEDDHSVENARLEMSTLTMGMNAGVDRAREEVSKFLMSKVDYGKSTAQIVQTVSTLWTRWGGLTHGICTDPTNILLDVQKYCVENPEAREAFGAVLRGLYDSEVVGEEDFVDWREMSASRGEGTKKEAEKKVWIELYGKGKAFVDVLEAMESDDDSDEEEESE